MTRTALVALSEKELNRQVSIAIRRAELLDEASSPAAKDAWHEVMLYEEQLAEIIPPQEITGGIARAGAVRAALAAGERLEADRLRARYLAEAPLSSERRAAIERAFQEHRERFAERFPTLLRSGRLEVLPGWSALTSRISPVFPRAA
jgi:hypothetical protein